MQLNTMPSYSKVAYRIVILISIAVFLGVVVSLAAIGFIECVHWLNARFLISPHSRIQIQDQSLLIPATLLAPTLGGLIVGFLLYKCSPDKRPLGPIDSIYSAQLRQPLPGWLSGVISTVASIVSLGFGASVGQYGPMVYMGSMAGGLIAQLKLHIPNLMPITVACGVAAAISTAFNAPIAGLIFAHEVILRHYSLQSFAPTTVAAATGYVVANVVFDRPPLFLVEFDKVSFTHEYLLFAALGLASALLAIAFMHLIFYISRISDNLRISPVFKPAIAGLMVGVVALWLPDVLGIGRETLRFTTIDGAFDNQELLLLVLAKVFLTAACVGLGFAGGVFSPALLIGGLFGAFFWSVMELLGVSNSGAVVYAICGMMAVNTAVIGAPLTTILIVFELTHSYDLTIAAMVSVVFANLLAFRVFGRSLFDVQLARRGIDLSFGRDRVVLENTAVEECINTEFVSVRKGALVTEVLKKMKAADRCEAFVTDDQNRLIGTLPIQNLVCIDDQPIDNYIEKNNLILESSESIWRAMSMLKGFIGEGIPVVSKEQEILGIVTEASLIDSYINIVQGIRKEQHEVV